MKKKTNIPYVLFGILFVSIIGSYQYFSRVQKTFLTVNSFESCAQAGYRVTTTYPETCIAYFRKFVNSKQKPTTHIPYNELVLPKGTKKDLDYKNARYVIDGQELAFKDGIGSFNLQTKQGEVTIKFVMTNITYAYDLNNDRKEDLMVLLRSDKLPGKVQFYIAPLIALNTREVGGNLVFVDYDIASAAFLYNNGGITLGYTQAGATSTIIEKSFVYKNDILSEQK